jgi:hypothetical protein
MGTNAFSASTTGCFNVGIGACAMGTGVVTGEHNIAIGTNAGLNMTTGGANIVMGEYAYAVAAGDGGYNIAIGARSMGCCIKTSSASNNVNVGRNSGQNMTSGESNTNIGFNTGIGITTGTNIGNFGESANLTGTLQTCLGGGDVRIESGSYSDCRAKCCIANSVLGLSFIKALKPRSYKWIQQNSVLMNEGTEDEWLDKGDHMGGSQRTHYGMIGQEVKEVLDGLSIDTKDFAGYLDMRIGQAEDWVPGRQQYDPDTGYEKTIGLRYDQFVSPLIKASQELDAKIVALTTRVTALE